MNETRADWAQTKFPSRIERRGWKNDSKFGIKTYNKKSMKLEPHQKGRWELANLRLNAQQKRLCEFEIDDASSGKLVELELESKEVDLEDSRTKLVLMMDSKEVGLEIESSFRNGWIELTKFCEGRSVNEGRRALNC
jgi:hypothetical protein